MVQQAAGGGRRNHGVSAVDGADGLKELFGWRILQEEPAGTGLDGGQGVLIEVEGGQHNNLDLGPLGTRGLCSCLLQNAPGCFNAVHAGHPDIHQDHIGCGGAERLESLNAVAGLGNHFKVRLRIDQHAKTRTDQMLVINQGHPDGCRNVQTWF